jgi:hypothetical protein
VAARSIRRRWPDETAATLRRAERLLDRRFDLLGYRDLDFGDPVDWHLDPVTGRRAPRVHWSRVPYLDPEAVGDHKVIWELNRHQWLVTLGRAYRATGQERYAAACADHLERWMDQNPPGEGVNWASSLEVAFRSVAWIWTLHLVRDSQRLTPDLFLRLLRHLVAHGRHIEAYLSTWFSPNTHLTGEALGLVYLGALLPRLPEADRWLETGLEILAAELERQVHPDGVYFEHATWYHRYTVDFYLHLLVLSRRHALGVENAVEGPLEKMLDHLMWIARPDGSTPLIGDDDGGRLLFLDARPPGDVRSTLATGAALFGREDLAHVAGKPTAETLWLLGREGLAAYDALETRAPDRTGRGFSDGGFYVTHDGWSRTGSHLVLRCGSPGPLVGHTHADTLSFDLTVHGVPLVVDPGTGSYADPEIRNQLRGALAHNALTLGDEPPAVPDEAPFAWKHLPGGKTEAWHATPRFDFFRGRNDGFRGRGLEAVHVRSLLSLTDDYWVIRDRVEGDVDLPSTLHLQYAAGTELRRAPGGLEAKRTGPDGTEVCLRVLPFGIDRLDRVEGMVSPLYGDVRAAPAAQVVAVARREQEIVTFLVPGGSGLRVDEANDESGQHWRLRDEGGDVVDQLILGGTSGASAGGGLTSDFEWTWIRWKASTRLPREIVLVDGTSLGLEGVEVIRTEGTLPWFTLRLEDGGRVWVSAPAGARFRLHVPGKVPVNIDASPVTEEKGVSIPTREENP